MPKDRDPATQVAPTSTFLNTMSTTAGAIQNGKDRLALVTGAGGFVATHLIRLLSKQDWRLRVTDLPGKHIPVLTEVNAEVIHADLTKPETLRGLVDGVEAVFHTAAIFSYHTPYDLLHKVNVDGTRNLLNEALKANPSSIVVWSSASVYGHLNHRFASETHPKNPRNAYELSKWEQERAAMEYWEEHRLPVTIIRPAAIYGQVSLYCDATALLGILNYPIWFLPGKGQALTHHVHVEDVARAALFLAQLPGSETNGHAYNICDDTPISVRDYVTHVCRYIGRLPPTLPSTRAQVYLTAYLLEVGSWMLGLEPMMEVEMVRYLLEDHTYSNSKLKSLGFEFHWPDIYRGIEKTVDWYIANGQITNDATLWGHLFMKTFAPSRSASPPAPAPNSKPGFGSGSGSGSAAAVASSSAAPSR